MWKGNIFTGMCHSVHWGGGEGGGALYGVTSCLAARSHFPSGEFSVQEGSLSREESVQGGVSARETPYTVKSGQYASYWKAFLWYIV